MIYRDVYALVTPTPKELAHELADMDEKGQAHFFNELATIVGKWDRDFIFQLSAVIESGYLTDEGRTIMRTIGEYGEIV